MTTQHINGSYIALHKVTEDTFLCLKTVQKINEKNRTANNNKVTYLTLCTNFDNTCMNKE